MNADKIVGLVFVFAFGFLVGSFATEKGEGIKRDNAQAKCAPAIAYINAKSGKEICIPKR